MLLWIAEIDLCTSKMEKCMEVLERGRRRSFRCYMYFMSALSVSHYYTAVSRRTSSAHSSSMVDIQRRNLRCSWTDVGKQDMDVLRKLNGVSLDLFRLRALLIQNSKTMRCVCVCVCVPSPSTKDKVTGFLVLWPVTVKDHLFDISQDIGITTSWDSTYVLLCSAESL